MKRDQEIIEAIAMLTVVLEKRAQQLIEAIAKLTVAQEKRDQELIEAIAKLTVAQEKRDQELIEASTKLVVAKREREALSEELSRGYGPASWKLTAPLRWTKGRIKSLVPVWIKIRLKEALGRLPAMGYSRSNMALLNKMSGARKAHACSDLQKNLASSLESEAGREALTITLVTYNNVRKWGEKFFDSLSLQNYPLNEISVIVVDNGSSEEELDELKNLESEYGGRFGSWKLYRRPNKGYGAGHDFAIRRADTKKVLVSNIDVEFFPCSLSNLMKIATLDGDDVACWELAQVPYEHPKYYDPVTLETSWCSHACILMDREKYEMVAGYEKRIFMYGEDVELSFRFRAYGYRLRYLPAVAVRHFCYETPGEVKELQFRGGVKSNLCLRFRYGSARDIWEGLVMVGFLVAGGAGFEGSRRMAFRSMMSALWNMPYYLKGRLANRGVFAFYGYEYEMHRDGAFFEVDERIYETRDMESYPLVSVITRTVPGRGFLLREAISSVANQIYPNIEHIVVEDGGSSATPLMEEARRMCGRKGCEMRYFPVDKKGRSHAANVGLKESRGRYVLFLDDDDLLFPDHISTLYSALKKDGRAGAAYSLAWEVLTEVDLKRKEYRETLCQMMQIFRQPFDRGLLFQYNYLPLQSVLFERRLYEEYGGMDESMEYLEDWLLWCRYAVNEEFVYVPKTTSVFRTPADGRERRRRQSVLHNVLDEARERQKEVIEKYGKCVAHQEKVLQEH